MGKHGCFGAAATTRPDTLDGVSQLVLALAMGSEKMMTHVISTVDRDENNIQGKDYLP